MAIYKILYYAEFDGPAFIVTIVTWNHPRPDSLLVKRTSISSVRRAFLKKYAVVLLKHNMKLRIKWRGRTNPDRDWYIQKEFYQL